MQKRGDFRIVRGRRAMAWYTMVAEPMAQIVELLDGSSPALRAVAARDLYDGGDICEGQLYRDGLRELGQRLPPGPWDG